MNEDEMVDYLRELLSDDVGEPDSPISISIPFAELKRPTLPVGLVVGLNDGSEFEVTVRQSLGAYIVECPDPTVHARSRHPDPAGPCPACGSLS